MPFNIRGNLLETLPSCLVSLMMLVACISTAQGQIEYENPEVSFSHLAAPNVEEATNWVREDVGNQYRLAFTRKRFFPDDSDITIRIVDYANSEFRVQLQVERDRILQGSIYIENYSYPGEPCVTGILDLDNNGLSDMKFTYESSGNSGHANIGMACYLLQYSQELHFTTFFVRDADYAWERDINNDGRFEILRGHHQDKWTNNKQELKKHGWVDHVFRKYLFINAYRITDKGLVLSNHLSPQFPMILMFDYKTDPFNIRSDKEFMQHGQFKVPLDYDFKVIRLKGKQKS